jgi:AraC-like DNA-binding protein
MSAQDIRIRDSETGITIVRKTHAGTNPERHFHESWELFYIIDGTRKFFFGSNTFEIKTGDFLCIRPNMLHRALNRPNEFCDLVNVYFDDTTSPFFSSILPFLEILGSGEGPVHTLRESERLTFIEEYQEIARELSARETGFVPVVQGLLAKMLVSLVRMIPFPGNPQPLVQMNGTATLVISYVGAHFRENVDLERISGTLGLSVSYVSRLFRQATRFTFVEYLSTLRIQEACRLLGSTNESVARISELCGFGSVTQFGRNFRKITGESALSWRKRSRISM